MCKNITCIDRLQFTVLEVLYEHNHVLDKKKKSERQVIREICQHNINDYFSIKP